MIGRITFRYSDQGGSDRRLRCVSDRKVAMSQAEATDKAKKTRMTPYQCDYTGLWHIGHKKVRERRGPTGD